MLIRGLGLKRTMYEDAGLDLLDRRFLIAV
jgi:hypothetical protein